MKNALKKNYINSVNLNQNTSFPYLVLDVIDDNAYPRNPGFQVMHWHEDLQFIYVLEGNIEVQTLDTSQRLQAGEAIFINREVIHYVKRIGSCHYNSFLFPARFLEFYPGSPVQPLVENVLSNPMLPFLLFQPGISWQENILTLLEELVRLEKKKTELYACEVLVRLSGLWLLILKNINLPVTRKESAATLRMQKMLRYIQEHYAEEISLHDLAASASISNAECSRCFKNCLSTSPCKYLTEFRLSEAAHLLQDTEEPIGSIAEKVGFQQMSHFGKCFKEKTGCSPREYRKLHR